MRRSDKPRWHLYGIYVADDLQYIGYTENPELRRYQHSINRFAGRDFTLRTLRTLKTRAAAIRADRPRAGSVEECTASIAMKLLGKSGRSPGPKSDRK